MKTVLIYRSDLLPISETFIRAQAGALKRYRPRYIGVRATEPSLLAPESVVICESSCILPKRLHKLGYEVFGIEPALHSNGLMRHLLSLGPALVHAHFATDAKAALPLAQALGVPLVVTLHGYDVTVEQRYRNPLRRWLGNKQLRRLWSGASLFLCVSEFIRERAVAAGFPAEKLIVHRIGIDTDQMQPRPEQEGRREVVFVGRLTEKKGCAYLIRAMQGVQQVVPTARLLVLGDGPLRAQLQKLAAELKVDCDFLGRQSHAQVIEALGNARVCAIPSVTASNGDSEGLPMILAEAQALGVPVAATRHAGIPEGIVDGRGGLLSEERDVAGLARNITQLFQDEALYADLRRRGRDLVLHEFDLKGQSGRLEMIYDDVIHGKYTQRLDGVA